MSCYIRYVLTEDRALSLAECEQALQQVDPAYEIDGDLILWNNEEYGQIHISYPGNPICDGDLELLYRLAQEKRKREIILETLRKAKCLIMVQPLWSDKEEVVGRILEPFFDWLLANRAGVLAVEGGFFFDRSGALN